MYNFGENHPYITLLKYVTISRMPDIAGGSIPEHVFYGSIMSEILRIARATLKYEDFLTKVKKLFIRMTNQGATNEKLLKQIDRACYRYDSSFKSFEKTSNEIKVDIFS